MKQINPEKKAIRKSGTKAGIAIVIILIAMLVIPFVQLFVETVKLCANEAQTLTPERAAELASVAEQNVDEGLAYILSLLVGILFLFPLFSKQKLHREIFRKEKKMDLPTFGILICLILGSDFLLNAFFPILDALGNLVGISLSGALMQSNDILNCPTTIIAACIFAPVCEELIFRGFAMRGLQKQGKLLALVVSSILFGLIHGNPFHAASAFVAGLIFGYVAMEYSIGWSIVLHFINNAVLCYLLPLLLGAEANACLDKLSLVGFVVSVVVLFSHRQAIGAWIRENMWKKPHMKWVLTSVGMLLALLFLIGMNIFTILPR